MKILGIDPGTATTGLAIITESKNNFVIDQFGVISTPKTDTDQQRLLTVFEDLESLIKKYKPDRLGVEKLFFTNNQKTAITVAQSRGVVLLLAAKYKLDIFEFTPLQVKNILCGYGKADKKQVQLAVKQIFKLKQIPKPDDAADSLAIALCAAWKKL